MRKSLTGKLLRGGSELLPAAAPVPDGERVRLAVARIVFGQSELGDPALKALERNWDAATQDMRDEYLRIADLIIALLSQPAASELRNKPYDQLAVGEVSAGWERVQPAAQPGKLTLQQATHGEYPSPQLARILHAASASVRQTERNGAAQLRSGTLHRAAMGSRETAGRARQGGGEKAMTMPAWLIWTVYWGIIAFTAALFLSLVAMIWKLGRRRE